MDLYTHRTFPKPSDLFMTSIVCMSNGISAFHTHFADHDLASGHAQKTNAKNQKGGIENEREQETGIQIRNIQHLP